MKIQTESEKKPIITYTFLGLVIGFSSTVLNGWLVTLFKENRKYQREFWEHCAILAFPSSSLFKIVLALSIPEPHDINLLDEDLGFNDSNLWIIILLCTTVLDFVLRIFGGVHVITVLDKTMEDSDEERRPLVQQNENFEANVENNKLEVTSWMHTVKKVILGVFLMAMLMMIFLVILLAVLWIPLKLATLSLPMCTELQKFGCFNSTRMF